MGDEIDRAMLGANQLEPIQDRRFIRFRISAFVTVGPEALSRHNVLQTDPVNIDQSEGVKLCEGDAVGVWFRLAIENQMFFESNVSVLLDLLLPGEPVTMTVQAGYHIIQPISIDIINMHLR